MIINYSSTAGASLGENSGPGYPPNASWSNPNNITTDDGSSATIGFFEGGQMGDELVASGFDFDIPDVAVIDGIEVRVDGSNTGCYGNIYLGYDYFDVGSLNTTYGSPTELWGYAWTVADINNDPLVVIFLNDVSGGDGFASVDYIEMTVYWHIDVDTAPADVPTRVDYKVFARDGSYLGLLPNVTSPLKFSQDKNTAGSTMEIKSAQDLRAVTEIDTLLTEAETELLTEAGLEIFTESTEIFVTTGDNEDYALYKNSNRIEAWLYNYWYPNGKRMFKGQVNRITFSYGGQGDAVNLLVYSDGFDTANYITRGLPASLTLDVNQASQNGYFTVTQDSKGAGWNRYGQTWLSGSVDTLGAITLKLLGTATVTVSVYDGLPGVGGNLLGSATKSVSSGSATDHQFQFAPLINISASSTYFFAVSVNNGQSIRVYKHGTSTTYANGSAYYSSYSGGSGGGLYSATTGDLYFKTYEGELTTTATFTSQDPVTGIASDVLADYNDRGGLITEGEFEATGLSVSYTWILSSVFEVLKKILELSPYGYYFYMDLGNATLDIKTINTTGDFTITQGRDIHQLDISMSIESVKNQLLFTGGDTGGGTNLYKAYLDSESSSKYGLRTLAKTDNRVTLSATADAIGETFIQEVSDEIQETQVTILNETMDITLLTPGKTIAFANFGNMIDNFVLEIVRRDYTPDAVVLTLGRLPITVSSTIQSITRGLLNEQTVSNPASPS